MRITLAQLNPTVGDLAGNAGLILGALARGREEGADVVVCPELSIIGYPPRDLLLREGVVRECEQAVRAVAGHAAGTCLIVGHPRRSAAGVRGVRNSASVCADGEIVDVYDKRLLPGYDVFDEDRYFDAGDRSCVVERPAGRVGILTCEDLWQAGDVTATPHYAVDPLAELVARGCDVVVCLNASPFIAGKPERHLELVRDAARRHGVPVVAVNQVGANDDLVFDGRSVAVGADGSILALLPAFESAVRTVDVDGGVDGAAPSLVVSGPPLTTNEGAAPSAPDVAHDLFRALVLGIADYCRKTRHEGVLVGLSGGIDSALTAALAVAALGPANVTGLIMPSRFSSPESRADALALAERLGLDSVHDVPIKDAHRTLTATLAPALPGAEAGLTDENVQARLRGLVLMAHANASGALVLATSNKSELAVGYSTLYGDMCGALSVLGDVLKRRVYDLSRWINEHPAACGFAGPPIPERSITKPPSAELRPNQTDQDSLPPYEVLDEIVERYVELEQSADRIITETGFDAAVVQEACGMMDRSEFKRHQASVILKVTHRAFGRGRVMPIVMRETPAPVEPERYNPDHDADSPPSARSRQPDRGR